MPTFVLLGLGSPGHRTAPRVSFYVPGVGFFTTDHKVDEQAPPFEHTAGSENHICWPEQVSWSSPGSRVGERNCSAQGYYIVENCDTLPESLM
jgi:hypothetical protein